MSASALRAGIIGLGVGEQHIAGYHAHPACDVVALCDFAEEKRHQVAARHPDIPVTAAASDILDDPTIDVVSIASWDNFHFEQIVAALRHDKHVFVEKPLVLHEHEAREIRRLLDAKPHLVLSSNLILRRCPRFIELKARIEAGDFGDLFHVEGDYNYGRIHKLLAGWRGHLDFYSMVLGGGVHMVDLLLWLTGRDVVEVQAYGNRIATRDSTFGNADMVVAILKFDDGMIGKVACNGGCVHPHFHGLNLYGTKASFLNDLQTARFYTARETDQEPAKITSAYPGAAKGDLLADFVDGILAGRQPEVSVDDVFKSLSVCFAIERAVRDGGAVPVDPL